MCGFFHTKQFSIPFFFFNLFLFGSAGSLLLWGLFSSCGGRGPLSHGSRAPGRADSVVMAQDLLPHGMLGSSWTRD